jgi:hypothetical protein
MGAGSEGFGEPVPEERVPQCAERERNWHAKRAPFGGSRLTPQVTDRFWRRVLAESNTFRGYRSHRSGSGRQVGRAVAVSSAFAGSRHGGAAPDLRSGGARSPRPPASRRGCLSSVPLDAWWACPGKDFDSEGAWAGPPQADLLKNLPKKFVSCSYTALSALRMTT